MADKQSRHTLLQQILRDHSVSSQEALVALLNESGVSCTQATLSRDLKELGVTREHSKAGPRYQLPNQAQYLLALQQVMAVEIISVKHNGSTVVVRTLVARAGGVAGYIDGMDHPAILGTIAGDDTVFIEPANGFSCEQVSEIIEDLKNCR